MEFDRLLSAAADYGFPMLVSSYLLVRMEGRIEKLSANFIFGGSRKRMHELAFGTQKVDFEKDADNIHIKRESDIERWAKDVYSFVSGKYGEQNIAAFIVHLDELNPHVHCTLLPIKDGRFAYKEIFAGKDKFEYSARMKQLHTDFFTEVNTRWGNVERNKHIRNRRTAQDYRRIPPYAIGRMYDHRGKYQPSSKKFWLTSNRTSVWQSAGSRGLRQWSITLRSRKPKKRPCYRQPNRI